jgi:predicted HicB family RNase H-like nuclease
MTDDRVIIGLELEQDLLYQLMLMAHEQDLTLNQLIHRVLKEYIEAHKNEQTD